MGDKMQLEKTYFHDCLLSKEPPCPSIPTLVQKLDEIRQHRGKALLGHLNISVNLMIKPAPSEWTDSLETITMRHGNCKAYSLAKYAGAQELGISGDGDGMPSIGHNHEPHVVRRIEAGVRALVEAREIVSAFHAMIRREAAAELTPWIERARASLVASFGKGVEKDEAAVRSAIILPWFNGQTEGQITRLKLVKRQMYGRAKIDLLQARLIGVQ
jgi:Transposase